MNSRLLYIYIFLVIFFADTYFVMPWLKSITILNYILIVLFLFSKPKKVNKEIKKIQILLLMFILYTVCIDFFQNGMEKAISSILSFLPIPFILDIFYRKVNNSKFIYFYAKWYVVYNGFFAILQLLGIYLTAGELLAELPFLGVDLGFWTEFGNQGLRVSGAGFSTIGFACTLGVIFILLYFTRSKLIIGANERKIYLIVIITLIIMTQTRSVLFSLIPVIYITNVYVSRKRIKTLINASIGALIVVGLFITFQAQIKQHFPRLFLTINEDGSVVHRIQANIYGVVGTFYRSPITGTPIKESKQSMDLGYYKVGLIVGNRYIDEVTQHNQPAYFFRYYGFIGLIFLVLVYRSMFKLALNENNFEFKKKIIFGIVLFHIMYTFFHNNKFTTDYYIWIFIALHFNEHYLLLTNPNYEKQN